MTRTLRWFLVWCAIVPIAILNGSVRDLLIAPRVGDPVAHVISTLLLCLAILALTWLTMGWIGPVDMRQAAAIGLRWLLLTIVFEFLAGRFVFGTPWSRLIADYDLMQGRIWIFVPVTTAIAPWLAWRGRHLVGETRSRAGAAAS